MNYILTLLLSTLLLTSCSQQTSHSKIEKITEKDSDSSSSGKFVALNSKQGIKQDSLLRDYSIFIAGIRSSANGSKIPATLRQNSFYQKYAGSMDSNFSKIEFNRLSIMRDWANVELQNEHQSPGVLFYPFSGPDILHAITLYPNATQYVMIAMERPGSIPDIKKMDSAQCAYYLNSVYQSLQDIFDKSYFITRKMITELQKEKVNGVAPLICLFLERTNHPVVALKKKHLNDDGSTQELAANSIPYHVNDFIEIYFRSAGSDSLRKIVYFRANLGDQAFSGLPSLRDNKTLQNYLNNLPSSHMYSKSASYLMNYGNFSAIRNICLSKSKSILQDDTGIGFKYFDKKVWKFKLYGHYVPPVSDFKWVYDTELANAYKTDSVQVKSLKFSLGYHWGNINNQNLMKAERQQ